jgi:hypothetical protein
MINTEKAMDSIELDAGRYQALKKNYFGKSSPSFIVVRRDPGTHHEVGHQIPNDWSIFNTENLDKELDKLL